MSYKPYPKMMENAIWFDANRNDLLTLYRGKYVAVADMQVLGAYDDQVDGVCAMLEGGHEPGTFIVHHCIPKEEEVPFICHSGVCCPPPLA